MVNLRAAASPRLKSSALVLPRVTLIIVTEVSRRLRSRKWSRRHQHMCSLDWLGDAAREWV